jgi:hypothetical protein
MRGREREMRKGRRRRRRRREKGANFFQPVSNLFCVVKRGFVEPCINVHVVSYLV